MNFSELLETGERIVELKREELKTKTDLNFNLDKICLLTRIVGEGGFENFSVKAAVFLAVQLIGKLKRIRTELAELNKEYGL